LVRNLLLLVGCVSNLLLMACFFRVHFNPPPHHRFARRPPSGE